jgi:hypothetical protein
VPLDEGEEDKAAIDDDCDDSIDEERALLAVTLKARLWTMGILFGGSHESVLVGNESGVLVMVVVLALAIVKSSNRPWYRDCGCGCCEYMYCCSSSCWYSCCSSSGFPSLDVGRFVVDEVVRFMRLKPVDSIAVAMVFFVALDKKNQL